MATVIETAGLTKYYGDVRGAEDVDLEVRRGEVFGFLGPNGAGKSTTIRLLLDFIRPTRGSATVLGHDARQGSVEIKRRVGYLPGELAMYERMTGRQLLTSFAALRGMSGIGDGPAVAARLELDLDRTIRSYSSGNRQKIALVQAFMHRPELFILDEPTNALDPLIQQEFYALIDEVRAAGRSVFLSSHILPEVERIADRVAIIRSGHIVATESVAELKRKASHRLELRFARPVGVAAFAGLPTVHTATEHEGGAVVQLIVTGPLDPVVKAAARYEVTGIVSHDGDLEEAFLAYYSEDGDAP